MFIYRENDAGEKGRIVVILLYLNEPVHFADVINEIALIGVSHVVPEILVHIQVAFRLPLRFRPLLTPRKPLGRAASRLC